jgi:hypothetical protein
MSDYISAITPSTDLNVSDTATWSDGTSKNTGDLRRKFNFGDKVSELAIAQDPFFRFVSKVSKRPTDDPAFKFTEKGPSWHKRYVYPVSHAATVAVGTTESTVAAGSLDAGDTYYIKFGTDYKNSGNIGVVINNSNASNFQVGDSGTQPNFLLPDQLIKINYRAENEATNFYVPTGYIVGKIKSTTNSGEYVIAELEIVKGIASAVDLIGSSASVLWSDSVDTHDKTVSSQLEVARCYVIGNAHQEGSGYPETWMDQPYSTGFGMTQIWKTSCAMTNTARATVLKYEANEWARVWKEKLVEHKFDIEQSLLFGSQGSQNGVQYTEGAVNFLTNYCNSFSLATDTKTSDGFLDDMSQFLDPRFNNANATVFFCNTAVYNWLHKLGGYFKNNMELSTNFSADLAVTGRKKVLGLDTTTISTVYGDMNVVRNIHLDGTNVKMLGINMKYCKYRPLVGNGVNRDTSVYVGVQTLENSGVDRRVDLILTEAGMEWQMPEAHAIWT